MQNILVVGAGAVGGFFGAHLARQYGNVSFLLRGNTLKAVREHGLVLRSTKGTLTVHPRVASDPSELPQPDIIILTNKVYDLPGVLDQLDPLLAAHNPVILTLQNGVDIEDRVVARYQRDCVVGGVAFIYSRIAQPGVIDHYTRGEVTIGELMGHASPRVQSLQELFTKAGIPCRLSEDIRKAKWEKMCWNCVFNPLTVVLNDRIAKALDQFEMRPVIEGLVGEVVAVAAGSKVPLAEDMAHKVVRWSESIRDIHTSMYDDWHAGRQTEIDDLNGFIVRRGRELGIPTPLNHMLMALVKTLTSPDREGSSVVRIEGAVVQSLSLDAEALANIPDEFQISDIGALMPGMQGKGVRVQGVLNIPALEAGADYVTFHSNDDLFSASLTLKQAMDFGILLYQKNGQPFPADKGGPFRLVTPGLGDLCANVKGVVRMEVTKGLGKDTRVAMKGRS